ncbi:MAG: tetratricopeptide repeat protein [Verrucomicrobiota bacterium]|nr:tetratricopeptide repeat protein [Verrucomicrobiota bacterium]
MKKYFLFVVVLIVLVMSAHWPALKAGFVWDDTALVLRDPLIRSWRLIPESFEQPLFLDATPSNFYRPLQRASYTLDYAFAAFRPFTYHLTNILLHAAAAIALFAFALSLLALFGSEPRARFWVAAFATTAWALHPLHSAVVDYVAGRADSLAALFGFLGLYFSIRAVQRGGRAAWKCFAAATLAFLLAALSREIGLVFPLIALVIIALRKSWLALTPALIVVVFVGVVYGALRAQMPVVNVPRFTPPAPLILRPLLAARALAEYAGLIVLPINLHVERNVEEHAWGLSNAELASGAMRELQTCGGAICLALLLFWLVRAWRRDPLVATLLLASLIAYLPVCGIFPLNANCAEHWVYLPLAFFLLAAARALARVSQSSLTGSALMAAIALVWMTFFGVRSFYRAQDWRDARTFFERTIASGGDSARMFINLAGLELQEHHLERAEALLKVALQKSPQQPFALLNLAAIAIERGKFDDARKLLAEAAKEPVAVAQADELLAVITLKETGKLDLIRWRLAAYDTGTTWKIERRYVTALEQSGARDKAIAELRATLVLQWYRAETWQLLGEELAKAGRTSEAASALAEAHDFDVHLGDR